MTDLVLRSDHNGCATLALNRPDKLNALTVPLFECLEAHLRDIAASPDKVGCVVLRGAGRSFCAGHDLAAVDPGPSGMQSMKYEGLVVDQLANLPQPVIGLVQGHCMTGGLELALASDIIIAGESAKFADTHGKWDLLPLWGMSQRLPRRIGRTKALEMMLTCRTYSGREAEAMGLVNLCVPDPELEATVQSWTALILANSWRSNRGNKKLLNDTEGLPLKAGLAHEVYRTEGFGPELFTRLARAQKK